MKQELDDLLCKKYPKIFAQRNWDMSQTCMCWGFDCGDGWFNIIDQLCGLIQWQVDSSRRTRLIALRYNRALRRAVRGDTAGLLRFYTIGNSDSNREWAQKRVDNDLADPQERPVGEACPQPVAVQVKEKFGTLRFYYDGGDDIVDGVVRMAEAMSSVTCEVCGAPGTRRGGPWVRTLCDEHDKAQNKRDGHI
jgi:hypothetical protein